MSGFIRAGVGTPWTHDLIPVQRDGHDDGWQPPIEPTRLPLGLGPRDVEDWGGAPTWEACDARTHTLDGRGGVALVRCSRRLGHRGDHMHPPTSIRTRYGIIRAVCHLCDWSTTRDLEMYQRPAWARAGAAAAASAHLRLVHHL